MTPLPAAATKTQARLVAPRAQRGQLGVIGNALQFNGSSTYVSVNYTSDLQLSSNMSIALWAKSTNSGNWGNTSGKGVGDFIIQPITGSNGRHFLGANDSTTKQVDFKVYIGGTLESINISPTTINTWNYYVATCSYSGSSTTMSLSVNGGTPNTATYSGALNTSLKNRGYWQCGLGKLPKRRSGRGAVVQHSIAILGHNGPLPPSDAGSDRDGSIEAGNYRLELFRRLQRAAFCAGQRSHSIWRHMV